MVKQNCLQLLSLEQDSICAVGVDFGCVFNDNSDLFLEVIDLNCRDCNHISAKLAEIGGLDLALIIPFESNLLDIVNVTLQMFLLRTVGTFCKLHFIYFSL